MLAMGFIEAFSDRNDEVSKLRDWLFALSDFGDHFGSFLKGVVGSRNSAINCLLQNDLLDIVGGEPTLSERRPHMHSELLPLVEREHRANNQDAARPLVIVRPRPDFAPGSSGL